MDDIMPPDLPSGRFLLRIEPGLHALLRDEAERRGMSLNEYCVLFEGESWADVVREVQEIVELTLNGLLRSAGIGPPRIHDVSEILLAVVDPRIRYS